MKQLVARGRFELPSGAPEAPMIDRYTTGLFFLSSYRKSSVLINKSLMPFYEKKRTVTVVCVRI